MHVALTFDDGPSQWTEPILDLFAEHRARATFFAIGSHVQERPGVIARALEEGHEIGNHTFNHRSMTLLTDEEAAYELADAQAALHAAGAAPTLWRAPHFSVNDRILAVASEFGLRHVGCDVDPGDWTSTDPWGIASYVIRSVRDGQIVDLHDGVPPGSGNGTTNRSYTVKAVKMLLDELDGWEFVTVSELSP